MEEKKRGMNMGGKGKEWEILGTERYKKKKKWLGKNKEGGIKEKKEGS